MKHRFPSLLLVWLCGLYPILIAPLSAQTDIRPTPGGKRILFVDGDDIRPAPGGKRLLFIDQEKELRPEPGGKVLLYIDGTDIRDRFGGIRIAFWDGWTLRRSPGGPILLFVDGDDLRPTMGGPRLMFFDGPKLSRAQATAVLYVLKPELFTLSAESTAAKQKEMSDNGASPGATGDPWLGSHAILSHNTSGGPKRAGAIIVTKQADYYGITYKTADNPAWQGIAVNVALPGSRAPELWAAVGPAGASSLGIYEQSGNSLRGVWVPVNASQDRSLLGFENLNGPAELGGGYKITSGKLPNGGIAYSGDLNIDPLPAQLGGNAKCYRIRWTTGTTAVGFQSQTKLAVAAGWGADCEMLRFRLENAGIVVDVINKAGTPGSYTLQK